MCTRCWLGHRSAVRNDAIEDVQVHFIIGRPQNASLAPAYQNAVRILGQVPFDNTVVKENQIDDDVDQIEGALRQHEKQA